MIGLFVIQCHRTGDILFTVPDDGTPESERAILALARVEARISYVKPRETKTDE